MDIERYKSELQSDLESHKAKLKAEYDLRHFEFQTRFSLFHQQQAEVIKELYRLLKETELGIWSIANPNQEKDVLAKLREATIKSFTELTFYINKNRIFFSEDICKELNSVCDDMQKCLQSFVYSHQQLEQRGLPLGEEHPMKILSEAMRDLEDKVKPVTKELEKQFREILSVESSNYQIEKKQ